MFCHIILTLLCWRSVLTDPQTPTIDQLAVATEADTNKTPTASYHDTTTPVYYQNSNGFIPMINYALSESSQASRPLSMKNGTAPSDYAKWTNDVLTAEARLLQSLPHANRRSLTVPDPQKAFEILKVTNETPAIANYHDFYENLQKNLQTKSAWSNGHRSEVPGIKTRERIRMIDEYFNHKIENQKVYQSHKQQDDMLQKPSTFEAEKVHDNYQQYATSGHFSYLSPSKPAINSQDSTRSERQNVAKSHQNARPVVILPTDYKVDEPYSFPQPSPEAPSSPYALSADGSEPEDRYDRKEDYPDGTGDYLEITERPRRPPKTRRRPYTSEGSRKPNDQRDPDDLKKTNSGRTRSRTRSKPTYWTTDTTQNAEDPVEHKEYPEPTIPEDQNQNLVNEANGWNQVAPNIELSQSNGYEINQMDSTKLLLPVNLNLVPLTNFNPVPSSGSMITATPLITSTASPLVSTPSMLMPKLPQNFQNLKNYAYPNGVPEVIVGQNTLQNPVQAVLFPQMNVQGKFPNVKTQYLASTISPMFTIAQPLSHTIRGVQSAQLPKLTTPGNQYGPQVFVPQSTMNTFVQTPLNTGNYNIFVNPRGVPGQDERQGHPSTLKYTEDSSDKRNNQAANTHVLTSASFSVSQDGDHKNGNNIDDDQRKDHRSRNKYSSSTSGHREAASVPKSEHQQNVYPVIRGAQVVPAIIHANGVDLINQNQGLQAQPVAQPTYVNQNGWRHVQVGQNSRNKYQNLVGIDSIGSTSNNNANTANAVNGGYVGQAQLPVVGMQTVEIRNPSISIKPSPVDLTMVNPVEALNHYGAVITTPIPILSTAGFVTPRPFLTSTPETINIQGYVDSLTQIGAQNNQGPQQSALFNPLNFVPNYDLIKSQTMLNKVHIPKPLPQHLNLVPIVPGGNFDHHSPAAQVELITKPKLSSDLEKYAEEMFKESLRTIYNTHKWNSDKKVRNLTDADIAELERLKSDLSRFKAAMTGTNYGKDLLEAHHSETKIRTVDPGQGSKKPGLTAAAIEQLFKADFKVNGQSDHHSQDGKNRPRETIMISDYLTPPKPSHGSKYEGSGKKRHKGRYEGKPRPHSKPKSRPASLDTASSHVIYSHRRPHDRTNSKKGYKKTQSFDDLPTFTTSTPAIINAFNDNDKSYRNDYMDYNNPRMHNLLGLLMKNKQLPRGSNSNYHYDEQDGRRPVEEMFYDDLGRFLKKSDGPVGLSQTLQLPKLQGSQR